MLQIPEYRSPGRNLPFGCSKAIITSIMDNDSISIAGEYPGRPWEEKIWNKILDSKSFSNKILIILRGSFNSFDISISVPGDFPWANRLTHNNTILMAISFCSRKLKLSYSNSPVSREVVFSQANAISAPYNNMAQETCSQ